MKKFFLSALLILILPFSILFTGCADTVYKIEIDENIVGGQVTVTQIEAKAGTYILAGYEADFGYKYVEGSLKYNGNFIQPKLLTEQDRKILLSNSAITDPELIDILENNPAIMANLFVMPACDVEITAEFEKRDDVSTFLYNCQLYSNSNIDLTSAIDTTILKLDNVLKREGFYSYQISKQGNSQIKVEVCGEENIDEILTIIENPQTLYMTLEQANGTNEPEIYISGNDIAEVNISYNNIQNQYSVTLDFTEDGKVKFADLTLKASNSDERKIFVYLGKVEGQPWSVLTCEAQITNGSVCISGDGLNDYESAKQYAYSIMFGCFDVQLTRVD